MLGIVSLFPHLLESGSRQFLSGDSLVLNRMGEQRWEGWGGGVDLTSQSDCECEFELDVNWQSGVVKKSL